MKLSCKKINLKNYSYLLIFIVFIFFLKIASAESIQRVLFKDISIKVEIADTKEKKTKGLMFRESLGELEGMLFVYPKEDTQCFWMKNMKFPIDIIWINSDKIIVDIKKNLKPCNNFCESIVPIAKAQYVLEVNAGFTDKHSISIGDEVTFSNK